MRREEVAALKPGDRVRWVPPPKYKRRPKAAPFDPIVTLSHRKEDGSGWWNTDGSGLDDRLALLSDSWERA